MLIASISALTLEGWQQELDPSICVMDHIQDILKRGDDKWGVDKFREGGVGDSPTSASVNDVVNDVDVGLGLLMRRSTTW